MSKTLDKNYNQKWEKDIYQKWEDSGFFNPDNLPDDHKENYCVSMPPPNVTGVLHLGHALENTIMDTQVRYQRMKGKRVLLLPGTDHAAVATQAKVEKVLQEKGIKDPRKELGREKLLEEIREYAENSKSRILSQIKTLGTSCDWSRLAYTFDEERNKAVNEIFVKMYKDGLIYRGYRTVNWSVKGQSTLSDDEVEYSEEETTLYTFRYSKDFPIAIATTRPETKLGDNAVAVNPEDSRYKQFIGQEFTVDVGASNSLKIKIIADENIDPNFGTGALGVTCAHSHIDYEIYQKNKEIGIIPVIGKDGKMNENAGFSYEGLTVNKAREKFVNWLKENDLLIKEEKIIHNIGRSDRFKDIVEVLPMKQWFVDVNKQIPNRDKSLKQLMAEAVENEINIKPKRFEKVYFHWIDNLRDWCISRQIWWGHRIPVWYRQTKTHDMKIYGEDIFNNIKSGKKKYETRLYKEKFDQIKEGENIRLTLVNKEDERSLGQTLERKIIGIYQFKSVEEMCEKLGIENIAPGWDLESLEKWYEQNIPNMQERLLEGGIFAFEMAEAEDEIYCGTKAPEGEGWEQDPDTLDTWFSSGTWTFSTLGWPEETSDMNDFHPTAWMQMGYEILFFWMARMILITTYGLGEIPFKDVYIHGMLRDKQGRKFSKSLGNGKDPIEVISEYGADGLRLSMIKGMTAGNDGRFYEEKVVGARNFVNKLWNISRYILMNNEVKLVNSLPEAKTPADKWILSNLNKVIKDVTREMDKCNFSQASEILYDFTWNKFADWYLEIAKIEGEKQEILFFILQNILKMWHPICPFVTEKIWENFDSNLIMVEKWPESFDSDWNTKDFEIIIEIVNKIRTLRAGYKIDPGKFIDICLAKSNEIVGENKDIIERLARVKIVEKLSEGFVKVNVSEIELLVNLGSVIDIEKELERIDKEIVNLEKQLSSVERQLSNQKFCDNAPAEVLEGAKRRKISYGESLEILRRQKEELGRI